MANINFLPPWVETNEQPAFYDKESGTVLQQTARMYAKVNQLVRSVNEQNETIADYIQQFIELKDYVEDYFENLDVQEEINNKIDSMVQDGSFQVILDNFVEPKLIELDGKITDEATARTEADRSLQAVIQASSDTLQAEISALASGSPIPVSDVSDMTDTTKVYVNTSDGKWYYYDGDSWEIGGTYQSTGIDPDDPVIAGKLDKQPILVDATYTRDSGWISTSSTIFPSPAGQHYEHIILTNVTAGDKYYISGYSVNSQYPGARISKGGYGTTTIEQGSGVMFDALEVTVPEGYTGGTLYVNGWQEKQGAEVKVYIAQDSDDYWTEFQTLKADVANEHKQLAARRDGNNIYFFRHNYKANTDLTVWFKRKAMNSLMDFSGWFTSSNTGDSVITGLPDPLARTQIIAGDTDWLAPTVVYSENAGDGDFNDFTSNKFTGGWHGYNNATTGTASATAREISCTLYVDDAVVTDGNYATGDNIKLIIVNNLQGSNTEKSNGTGREIIQQKFIITMNKDSNKITVESEVKALEDVIIERHYGMSMYRANMSDTCYVLGSHSYHSPFDFNALVRNDGKETTGIVEKITATSDSFVMDRDNTYGLGDGYANHSDYGVLVNGGKAYNQMANAIGKDLDTYGLHLSEDDIVRWRGSYDVNPTSLV